MAHTRSAPDPTRRFNLSGPASARRKFAASGGSGVARKRAGRKHLADELDAEALAHLGERHVLALFGRFAEEHLIPNKRSATHIPDRKHWSFSGEGAEDDEGVVTRTSAQRLKRSGTSTPLSAHCYPQQQQQQRRSSTDVRGGRVALQTQRKDEEG
eukprot:3917431-Rhodomonas_salina.1